MRILYYGFGGGLGHITRFNAFCYTLGLRPILMTALEKVASREIKTLAEDVLLLPRNLISDKLGMRLWIKKCLNSIKPDLFIIDAFPGGILGELTDLSELDNVRTEYLARILKVDVYKKRLNNGILPRFNKIWQVEEIGEEQKSWLDDLANKNNIQIINFNLNYPDSSEDFNVLLPDASWLIVHSGSEKELKELYDYANDIAMLENKFPNLVVVGQISRPDFLPKNIPYYSIYPIFNLLKKSQRVFSGAGFNMVQQMCSMREKHFVLPFERALDDQFLRVKLKQKS